MRFDRLVIRTASSLLLNMRADKVQMDTFDIVLKACHLDSDGKVRYTSYHAELLKRSDGSWVIEDRWITKGDV